MSISINFNKVVKKYGDNTIIPDLSLKIDPGEFFTLLGPSGCGKTTLLRMVAGFNSIEGGTIDFDGKVINDIPPGKRNIGMVFQNYAIFPHLSVGKNVAFGLENRGVSKSEISEKVDDILRTVKMEKYKDRMPDRLSGGQQQRIALARAIVIHPDVLLMDEPLSNLDAKLRIDMRNSIREIQKKIGITTVYVTHDQEEAMAVSDRIAIMKDGILQHVGKPRNIYHRPANVFVATFIGHSNILNATLLYENGSYLVKFGEYVEKIDNLINSTPKDGIDIKISARPEEFIVCRESEGIPSKIINSTYLGLNTHYKVEMATGNIVHIVEESTVDEQIKVGSKIGLKLNIGKINIFSWDGSVNFTEGVINDVDKE